MARWTKNHMLELGVGLGILGLIGTVISFTDRFAKRTPSWLQWYHDTVNITSGAATGDYNLVMLILGPILLIWGGFWIGEQIVMRRRFERMLDTPKRSEFSSRRSELESLVKRLPDGYKSRIAQKESEFVSKR